MSKQDKKWLMFGLRWGIALAGIVWVIRGLHFHDHIKVLRSDNTLADVQVLGQQAEDAPMFRVRGDLFGGAAHEFVVPRARVWTRPNRKTVDVRIESGQVVTMTLLALRPPSRAGQQSITPELLVENPRTRSNQVISPIQVVTPHFVVPSYPLVEMGLMRMVEEANPIYLLAALAIMPLSYLLTSYRWHLLLETLDIHIGQARTFIINMVGAFYNAFMPGTTGGDVAKAYYAARHTEHRTRAVLSVIVDRVVGLIALIILGGAMAAIQYRSNADCRRIALACGALLFVSAVGLVVFYHRPLRRATGLAWLLKRLPMQRFVHNAVHAMELYGEHPGRMLAALLVCFPVHITTIISATFAGQAFGLPLSPLYYWVIVPVIALVGAIPISPQGAGVMEFFAIQVTKYHHTTVGQAVALVMSIRLVQMFWNLVAGLFVLRGGYHAPSEAEAHELEEEDSNSEVSSTPPAFAVAQIRR